MGLNVNMHEGRVRAPFQQERVVHRRASAARQFVRRHFDRRGMRLYREQYVRTALPSPGRFDMIDPENANRDVPIADRFDESLAAQIPQRELHDVDRTAEQLGNRHQRETRIVRTIPAGCVQDLEKALTQLRLALDRLHGMRFARRFVTHVIDGGARRAVRGTIVCGTAHGITEDSVRFDDFQERLFVASVSLVRMIERREETIRLRDDQRMCVSTDLQQLVVIRDIRARAVDSVDDLPPPSLQMVPTNLS